LNFKLFLNIDFLFDFMNDNKTFKKRKIIGLGLVSGGLDSLIACLLLQLQGIKIIGLNFSSPFCQFDKKSNQAECNLDLFQEKLGIKVHVLWEITLQEKGISSTHIRELIFELAQKYQGLNQEEYLKLNHRVSDALSKRIIQRKLSETEALIIQTVQLLGEIDVILNNMNSRLREWYGLHFPELGLRIKDHQTYVKIVSLIGERALINSEKLQALGVNRKLSRKIEELAETSMGAPFKQEDMIGIRELANLITELEKYREAHSNYIIKITEEFTPNISTLAGPLLTAKLLEKAGSLKRMAMLPSSTIQVLGAGKAMFRAIKTGAKPPKHGLLFQHPYVHGASRKERGKRARELAGKIAIASRADYFTGNFIADQLKEQLSTK